MTAKPDLVLLIHGTWAADASDTGNRWWQCGSDFWTKLNRRLAGHARCTEPGEVFHWSGENLETDRRTGSHDLLQRLRELEQQQQPYHLVAHSHGGNVMLSALLRAGSDLKYLRSWATVGTPFFRFNTRAMWTVKVVVPALLFLAGIAILFVGGILSLARDQNWLDPGGGISLWWGWVPLVIGGVLTYSVLYHFGPVAEMYEDERARIPAADTWDYRWLSLWSPEDEAIAGLITASEFEDSFLPRAKKSAGDGSPLQYVRRTLGPLTFTNRMFFRLADRLSGACVWVVEAATVPLRNRYVLPFIEGKIVYQLRKTALGDDTFGAGVKGISVGPFDSVQVPEVQDTVTQDLVKLAHQQLAKSSALSETRGALSQIAFGPMRVKDLTDVLKKQFDGKELVHTNYFDVDEVIDMLAIHIQLSQAVPTTPSDQTLADWVNGFYVASNQAAAQTAGDDA